MVNIAEDIFGKENLTAEQISSLSDPNRQFFQSLDELETIDDWDEADLLHRDDTILWDEE